MKGRPLAPLAQFGRGVHPDRFRVRKRMDFFSSAGLLDDVEGPSRTVQYWPI